MNIFNKVLILGILLSLYNSAQCLARMPPDIAHQAIIDIQALSSDRMGGRKPGESGHQLATDYVVKRFSELNLKRFNTSFLHEFSYKSAWNHRPGRNVIGWIKGRRHPDSYIVFTAHYDHLGNKGGKIYNGADDNASGVAALMAMASHFTSHPPQHSLIFIATDAEEAGLHGAKAFLKVPPVLRQKIKLNINIDMISNGGRRHQLFILTSNRSPTYSTLVSQYSHKHSSALFRLTAGQPINVGRTRLAGSKINWRKASDHAAFAKYNIPYVYFGNDVHPHYHQVTDTFENIDTVFFENALHHIGQISIMLDSQP